MGRTSAPLFTILFHLFDVCFLHRDVAADASDSLGGSHGDRLPFSEVGHCPWSLIVLTTHLVPTMT